MPDRKCFAVLDADGFVIATHAGLSDVATAPEGGTCIRVGEDSHDRINGILSVGKRAKIVNDFINEEDALQPQVAPATPDRVKGLRRQKMRLIGDTSVAGRGRVFKEFPHIHMMDQHRHIDVLVMYMRGKLKDEDTVITRHLKSGEYESVKVGTLLDEIEKTFWLRQELRKRDQLFRDKVNAVYRDQALTDEQKLTLIDAIEVPEHLDVDEKSTPQNLMLKDRASNGK